MAAEHLSGAAAVDASASAVPWSRSQLAAELARDDRRYLVALDGTRVVGLAGIALLHGGAHVMTVAVAPSHRRCGVGESLVRALVEEADAAGLAVTLEVRASNDPARRLYRRLGFEHAGVRPGYYPDGEDAVILWRR